MSLNIEGCLSNYRGRKINIFQDETGKFISDKEARKYLAECQLKGWKLIPMGDCEGFDHFGGGCPGHVLEDEVASS